MNIDDIKRLTGRIPLDENARTPKASVEFSDVVPRKTRSA